MLTTIAFIVATTLTRQVPEPGMPVQPAEPQGQLADGDTVTVNKGKSIIVNLPNYGDGGYKWKITRVPKDARLKSLPSIPVDSKKPVVGAWPDIRYQVTGVRVGKADWILTSYRPWEKKGHTTGSTWKIHVVVIPAAAPLPSDN